MRRIKEAWLPLLLGAIMMVSCSDIKDPEFRRVQKFGLRNVSLQDATIGFEVTYFNPNKFGVTVKETEADIYLDTVFMGKFVQDGSVEVPKNAEFSIPLSGRVSLQKAKSFDLENIANKEFLLKANGSTRVGKAGVYIKRDIKYEGKHRLDEVQLR